MLNALLGLGGSLLSGLFGGGSGGQPGAMANFLSGATASRIPGQTQAGEWSPANSDQGQTYNYIPTGATQIDPALINMILSGMQRPGDTAGVVDPRMMELLNRMMTDPTAGRALERGTTAGNMAYNYGTGAAPNFAALSGQRGNDLLSSYDSMLARYANNPFIEQGIARGGVVGDQLTNMGAGIAGSGADLAGQLSGAAGQALSNPFSGQALAGAQTGGNMLTGASTAAYDRGGALAGTAMQGLPAASQVLNTAFDPQNALYDRTLRKTQDQLGTYLANSGLTSSGAGAQIYGDAIRDFNIDWQNNQLGRQTAGLGAFNQGVYGTGASLGAAGDMQSGAAQNYGTGAAMPYNTYSSITGQNLDVLNQLGSGLGNAAALQQFGLGMQGQGANFAAQNYAGMYDPLMSALNSYSTNGLSGFTGLTNNMNNLYGSGINNTALGGSMPYDLSTGITNNQFGALGNYLNANTGLMNMGNSGANTGLSYLDRVLAGSRNAADATKTTSDITRTQNAGAAAGLSPLIQGGFNALGSLFGGGGGYTPSQPRGFDYTYGMG